MFVRPFLVALSLGTSGLVLTAGCDGPVGVAGRAQLSLQVVHDFSWLIAGDFITHFGFALNGELWIATFDGEVIRAVDGGYTRFDMESIVGGGRLWDLFIDDAGRPWVAVGEDIAVFENGAWVIPPLPDLGGLPPGVSQVAATSSGDIVVAIGNAGGGGVIVRRDGVWTVLTPENSDLPSPLVRSLDVSAAGDFWVGAAQFQGRGGLSRIAGNRVEAVIDTNDGLLYNWVDGLDAGGTSVFAAFAVPIYNNPDVAEGGIQRLDTSGTVLDSWFPFSSGLTSNRVRSVIQSSSGELWFTTGTDLHLGDCQTCVSGVGVMDESGRFEVVSSLNSHLAPNEYLPWIAEAPDGAVHVAGERIIWKVRRESVLTR